MNWRGTDVSKWDFRPVLGDGKVEAVRIPQAAWDGLRINLSERDEVRNGWTGLIGLEDGAMHRFKES